MRLAVLSDLHLGAKDRLDRFARADEAEERLVSTLRELEREVDRVVLLGDIFETLRGVVPGTRSEELNKALRAYPEIARRVLDDPRYTFIFGNHDLVARRTLGAPEFYAVESKGRRALFFHGHQADWISRGEARLSHVALWVSGLLERVGVGVTQWSDRYRHIPPAPDQKGPITAIESKALAIGRSMGADIVVNGHTHRAIRHDVGDQIYLNSGTCLLGNLEYVLLDLEADRYEIHQSSTPPISATGVRGKSKDGLQAACSG